MFSPLFSFTEVSGLSSGVSVAGEMGHLEHPVPGDVTWNTLCLERGTTEIFAHVIARRKTNETLGCVVMLVLNSIIILPVTCADNSGIFEKVLALGSINIPALYPASRAITN